MYRLGHTVRERATGGQENKNMQFHDEKGDRKQIRWIHQEQSREIVGQKNGKAMEISGSATVICGTFPSPSLVISLAPALVSAVEELGYPGESVEDGEYITGISRAKGWQCKVKIWQWTAVLHGALNI